jgi:hypothetical protein
MVEEMNQRSMRHDMSPEIATKSLSALKDRKQEIISELKEIVGKNIFWKYFFRPIFCLCRPFMIFAVLRIRDVYPGSEFFPSRIRIFSILDPHQRI